MPPTRKVRAAHSARVPVTLGIVGSGEIVRMVLGSLQAARGLRVTAVAGTNAPAVRRIAGEFAAAACRDYRELLRRDDVAAVYVATPPHLHCEITRAALAAGKHVVCEKPLVLNLDQLRRIESAHRRRPDLKVASCSSRFHCCPPVRRARELIASGRLGDILTVRLNTSSEYPRPAASLPAWKRRRATSGGGLLMDWGVYDLDWLQFLLGDLFEPESVVGATGSWRSPGPGLETSYTAHLRCRNGSTISLARGPEHGPEFQRAEVRGAKGGADVPFMPGAKPEHLLLYRRRTDGTLGQTTLPEMINDWDAILSFPVVDLIHALGHGSEVASPLSHQRKIYTLIAAIYQSAASGKSVPLAGPLRSRR